MIQNHRNDYGYIDVRSFRKEPSWKNPLSFILLLIALFFLSMWVLAAHAEETINVNALANAIYKAEGGANTRHPYGILRKYQHTSPRQACINTIKSNLKRWNGEGDFILFLSKTYCPIGAKNDPKGLNKNWVTNVTYFYNKEVSNA